MLADFQTLIDDLLRDGSQWVSAEQQTRAIELALIRYSSDRPRELVVDVTSAGGKTLPLPAEWVASETILRRIETPVGEIPPTCLPSDEWAVYRAPAGEEIRLAKSLAAGETARLSIGVPHQVDDLTDTVQVKHREAVACYAAGFLAEQIATLHANDQDSTIAADRVDQAHPAREWAARAKSYRNRYYASLGITIGRDGMEEPRQEAAGAVVDLELPSSLGARRLYPRR